MMMILCILYLTLSHTMADNSDLVDIYIYIFTRKCISQSSTARCTLIQPATYIENKAQATHNFTSKQSPLETRILFFCKRSRPMAALQGHPDDIERTVRRMVDERFNDKGGRDKQ